MQSGTWTEGGREGTTLGGWRVTRDIVLLLCVLRGVNIDMVCVEGGSKRLLNVTILVRKREHCLHVCPARVMLKMHNPCLKTTTSPEKSPHVIQT